MKKHFWYFLYGRLRISVDSPFANDFVNSCIAEGINLRDISFSDGLMLCDISSSDFMKARGKGLMHGSRVRILSRKGFVCNLLPLVKRPFLFGGLVLSLIYIFFMASFVWDISVLSHGVDNRELSRYLADLGLQSGISKSAVDNEKIKNLVLLDWDELAWFTVNVSGCRAEINYSLKNQIPELIAKDEPCNVVSDSLAVIKSIDTYKGTCRVLRGDTVFPGDIIISSEVKIGNHYSDEFIYHFVHARGDVWGRTWYDLTAVTPRLGLSKTYNGKIKRKVYLKIDKKRCDISFGYGNHSGDCDIILKEYALGFGVVLGIESREYFSLAEQNFTMGEYERLRTDLENSLLRSMDRGRIIASVFSDNSDADCYRIRLSAECIEQIGVQKPINTNDSGS